MVLSCVGFYGELRLRIWKGNRLQLWSFGDIKIGDFRSYVTCVSHHTISVAIDTRGRRERRIDILVSCYHRFFSIF